MTHLKAQLTDKNLLNFQESHIKHNFSSVSSKVGRIRIFLQVFKEACATFYSNFLNERNGIIVLGVDFFRQTGFEVLTSHF